MEGERVVARLRCREVLAELSDYFDDALPADRREQLESHVHGCKRCEQFGGRFARDVQLLRRRLSDPESLDTCVAERLRDRLRRELA